MLQSAQPACALLPALAGSPATHSALACLPSIPQVGCLIESPTSSLLGVSPPVRSGASNPLIHDVKWGVAADLYGGPYLGDLRSGADAHGSGPPSPQPDRLWEMQGEALPCRSSHMI